MKLQPVACLRLTIFRGWPAPLAIAWGSHWMRKLSRRFRSSALTLIVMRCTLRMGGQWELTCYSNGKRTHLVGWLVISICCIPDRGLWQCFWHQTCLVSVIYIMFFWKWREREREREREKKKRIYIYIYYNTVYKNACTISQGIDAMCPAGQAICRFLAAQRWHAAVAGQSSSILLTNTEFSYFIKYIWLIGLHIECCDSVVDRFVLFRWIQEIKHDTRTHDSLGSSMRRWRGGFQEDDPVTTWKSRLSRFI